MSDANQKQVGGSHYRSASGVQHWDLMAFLFGPAHFICTSSKYVTRQDKKNGLEDLEKAEHYIEKLLELFAEGKVTVNTANWRSPAFEFMFEDYAQGNGLDFRHKALAWKLFTWQTEGDLEDCLQMVSVLIKEMKQ